MDYQAIYNRLIARAFARDLSGYSERHHIVPKCMGGDNSPANIVRLTPEEHYVAHQLLMKIHPQAHKLAYAAYAMTFGSGRVKRNNKAYGWVRRAFSKSRSAEMAGKPRGPHTPETRGKMSAASKGVAKSDAHRAALSLAKTGKKLKPFSEDRKLRHSAAVKASMWRVDRTHMQTPEYKAAQSQKMREIWAQRKASQSINGA